MNIRFVFEAVVGAICFLAILFFGSKGESAPALFALLPIIMRIKKIKFDERERQLFYKPGILTLGLTVITLLGVNYLTNYSVNGNNLSNYWVTLSITGIV
jgi:hypothetical protein